MLESQDNWNAVDTYCEEVIYHKEDAEWWREDDAEAPPLWHRRRGMRKRQFAAGDEDPLHALIIIIC